MGYRVPIAVWSGDVAWTLHGRAAAALGRPRRETAVGVYPGFVTDCLETLYELGIEAKEEFIARCGGTVGDDGFTVAPCLNDQPDWLDVLAEVVRTQTKGWIDD